MLEKNKKFSFDIVIFILLFGLLPVDMLNGYLLREVGVSSLITISQIYKIIILFFLFIRVNSIEKVFFLSLFLLLIIPTLYQILTSFNIKLIFVDAVKIIKYLGSVLAFFYFRNIFVNKGHLLKWVYRWFLFSFMILIFNIFLKLFGFGFPMYTLSTFEIGTKGFFYAGNEVSVVLIILSSFLMYWYQINNKSYLFVVIGLLSIVTGILITSKAAILGPIFTFSYFFIFKPNRVKIKLLTIFSSLFFLTFLLPSGLFFIINYLRSADIAQRLSYFWNELDFFTFLMSNRNNFLLDFIEIFKKNYNIIEVFIGVGQSSFETLNNNRIIELDFFDIYFAYGFIGIFLFMYYILFLIVTSKIKSLNKMLYPFSHFSSFIILFLIFLSFLSGHIFNSGMASLYIGCVFSIMYYKNKYENKLS